VGISCAGTALKDAVDLLEPLASDVVDFVRQGALMALAMVLMQSNKEQAAKVETVRKMFEERIADKHEETLAKFGAIIASGIIDAGGRNVTITLASRAGHSNLAAIVGMAVFTQYWYWYPYLHFISLAFTSTAIIGLNKDLKMPKFQYKCNARPSLFAYPPPVKQEVKVAPTKVAAAVLSTAAKAKSRRKEDAMDTTPSSTSVSTAAAAAAAAGGGGGSGTTPDTAAKPATEPQPQLEEKKPEDKDTKEKDDKQEKEKQEPAFEILQNPARVTPVQLRHITFDVDTRYVPIKQHDNYGIIMLRDLHPEQPVEYVGASSTPGPAAPVAPALSASSSSAAPAAAASTAKPAADDASKEPDAPAPFEFDG